MAFGLPRRAPGVSRVCTLVPAVRAGRMAPIFQGEPREPERKLRATIFLVDSDLGFVFWLGQALDSAGCWALPAKDVSSAVELLTEYRLAVDILVINPFLPDAFSFISQLRLSQPALHVIAAIPTDWEKFPPLTGVDAVIRKPNHLTVLALLQWINLIRDFLAESSAASGQVIKIRQSG